MYSKFIAALAPALVLGLALPALAADPAKPQAAAAQQTPDEEKVVAEFRKELAAKRADVMAKGLTLTAEQAAKFWPMFETFQKEQDVIVNEQIGFTEKYAQNFQNLGEKDALTYVNALLDRDQKMHDLRVKWLAKFQTVIPAAMAARAIQLDRRLGNVMQVQLSQRIPLVH